jgi:hypothetical protein
MLGMCTDLPRRVRSDLLMSKQSDGAFALAARRWRALYQLAALLLPDRIGRQVGGC